MTAPNVTNRFTYCIHQSIELCMKALALIAACLLIQFQSYKNNMTNNTVNIHHRTLYNKLDIPCNSTAHDIKLAYRRLAIKYHPDKYYNHYNIPSNSSNDTHSSIQNSNVDTSISACDKFIEVQQAYEILVDPYKRKQYDDQLRRTRLTSSFVSFNTINKPSTNNHTPANTYISRYNDSGSTASPPLYTAYSNSNTSSPTRSSSPTAHITQLFNHTSNRIINIAVEKQYIIQMKLISYITTIILIFVTGIVISLKLFITAFTVSKNKFIHARERYTSFDERGYIVDQPPPHANENIMQDVR